MVDTLREAGRPLTFDDLAARIGGDGKAARRRLQSQLEELLQPGEIIRNRRGEYMLRERVPQLVVGTVSGHRDGHGFVLPDDRSAPVFLAPRQMQETMHGDRVAVRVSGQDNRGRPQGALVEVLERNTRDRRSLVRRGQHQFRVRPTIRASVIACSCRVAIWRRARRSASCSSWKEQPSRTAQALGHVTRVLGEHAAPGMETEIAIHSHGLPFEFPREAVAEADVYGKTVSAAAKRGREDLRELPLVTIDGEDARDFDDAVYCEEVRGGWRLIVAIADVATYVSQDSALDREAQNRGTSVYFPNRVLPMLPEALSNGLCSLNPKVNRLCMICEMRVNPQGKVTRAQFFEG